MLMLLRRVITRNWLLKAFSLVLAVLMWAAIGRDSNALITRTVPLVFLNPPVNMEITGETSIPITLQLRGSFDLLAGLSSVDITPTISLAGEEPGPKTYTISPDNVDTPPGVEVFSVNPDRIALVLERTVVKDVEIYASVAGEPAEGYRLGEVIVTPSQIQIEGAESNVDTIEALSTAQIRIDGRTTSLNQPVNLDIPDAQIRLDSFAPIQVLVQIVEITDTASLTIEADPALLETWAIDVSALDVTLSGPASEIEDFEGDDLYFVFDPARVEEDGTVTPEIRGLPDSFEVVEFSPDSITVSPAP